MYPFLVIFMVDGVRTALHWLLKVFAIVLFLVGLNTEDEQHDSLTINRGFHFRDSNVILYDHLWICYGAIVL